MTKLTESDIEQMTIEILQGRGYEYLYGPDIAPDGATPLRASLEEVVLRGKLEAGYCPQKCVYTLTCKKKGLTDSVNPRKSVSLGHTNSKNRLK